MKAFRKVSHATSIKSRNSSTTTTKNNDMRKDNRSSTTLDTSSESTSPPNSQADADSTSATMAGSDATVTPRRPINTNRYSVMSQSALSVVNGRLPSSSPQLLSPLAPHITSISDGSSTHQKVLLIRGQIGDYDSVGDLHLSGTPVQKPYDGTLFIFSHQDSFPVFSVPVVGSRFKVLVHLQAGKNLLKFEFVKARASHSNGMNDGHINFLTLNYMPLNASPPLHLAILVAKDSPETFDVPPRRMSAEGNNIDMAKRKYRMAAYLWQAYTADQMQRNGFFSRVFRLEEEWQPSTLGGESPQPWRSEARIHVIRLDKTVAELRSPDYAQQNPNGKETGALFDIAMGACKSYFRAAPGQKQYVSAMFLDSHWDPKLKLITAHAALGGGDDQLGLAIFGSQALHSYPSCIQDVIPAFTDCTPTDTKCVANDCGESGSSWEAANIGIGAHLHEVGHLFGLPHRPSGVMLRDYVRLNRTFTVGEPFSTRTKSQGKQFCPREEECAWSRLDCLRFRYHPCFRHNMDRYIPTDGGIQVWGLENEVTVTADAGIAWIEIYADDDEMSHAWKEFLPRRATPGHESPRSDACPRAVRLIESEFREQLKAKLPSDSKRDIKKVRLQICSTANVQYTIEDFGKLTGKAARSKLPNGQVAYRSGALGFGSVDGPDVQTVFLESTYLKTKEKDILGNINFKNKVLRSIRVYHGDALDGLEFCYEDATSQMFGKRGGKEGGDEFTFDTRRGETLAGIYLRAGQWIDGIQFITTMTGRKSPLYGNANGGSGHTLIPPTGYRIAGFVGSCSSWLTSLQLLVTR
ncbi:hypothetical protein BLS_008568 [Venturia inaequalis]|uniref:Jacalin-type lectin domain-containing protein n=1 Tax=Venturia inaequalis TaxID=5025 RepID=A0A8H3U6X4_VENIN|nr:hypothetical protein BLS_008568 [Venturia inaequalis]